MSLFDRLSTSLLRDISTEQQIRKQTDPFRNFAGRLQPLVAMMQQAEEQKRRDEALEYARERDALSDRRYAEEIDYQRKQEKARLDREAEAREHDLEREGVMDERYDEERRYDLSRDRLLDQRYDKDRRYSRRRDRKSDRRLERAEQRAISAADAKKNEVDTKEILKQWDIASDQVVKKNLLALIGNNEAIIPPEVGYNRKELHDIFYLGLAPDGEELGDPKDTQKMVLEAYQNAVPLTQEDHDSINMTLIDNAANAEQRQIAVGRAIETYKRNGLQLEDFTSLQKLGVTAAMSPSGFAFVRHGDTRTYLEPVNAANRLYDDATELANTLSEAQSGKNKLNKEDEKAFRALKTTLGSMRDRAKEGPIEFKNGEHKEIQKLVQHLSGAKRRRVRREMTEGEKNAESVGVVRNVDDNYIILSDGKTVQVIKAGSDAAATRANAYETASIVGKNQAAALQSRLALRDPESGGAARIPGPSEQSIFKGEGESQYVSPLSFDAERSEATRKTYLEQASERLTAREMQGRIPYGGGLGQTPKEWKGDSANVFTPVTLKVDTSKSRTELEEAESRIQEWGFSAEGGTKQGGGSPEWWSDRFTEKEAIQIVKLLDDMTVEQLRSTKKENGKDVPEYSREDVLNKIVNRLNSQLAEEKTPVPSGLWGLPSESYDDELHSLGYGAP
jgi:hypothetical protein